MVSKGNTRMHELTRKQYNRIMRLIKVLRSDLYKQGHVWLRQNDCYCCLGVACDISGLCKWTPSKIGGVYYYLKYNSILPEQVQEYYGFPDNYGCCKDGLDLVLLNGRGFNFKQIADIIEKWVSSKCKIIKCRDNNDKIILSVQGGCVDVVTKPNNLEIEIWDYDCPNDFDSLVTDKDGDKYQRILL